MALFEQWAAAGVFDREPDFPAALQAYRDGIREQGGEGRKVKEWFWLAEMARRVLHGKSPVTEAEYVELSEWFHRHKSEIPIEERRYVVESWLCGTRSVTHFSLDSTFDRGPRRMGATAVVEKMQELKAAHPELE